MPDDVTESPESSRRAGRAVRELPYDVVDVFGEGPLTGNPLAVVHGAEDLPEDLLQAIARELNLSETTFPGAASGTSYPVRIFTPGAEIGFAGHPTLGTAWVLRANGEVEGPEVVQHCGVGPVPVRFLTAPDGVELVELEATPVDLLGPLADDVVAPLLAELGLSPADRAGEAWVAGTGLDFVHLPVTEEAVVRARPMVRPLDAIVPDLVDDPSLESLLDAVNLVALDVRGRTVNVHARVFVPGLSVPEDPATGSAAAGLGVALAAGGVLPDGGDLRIALGAEIGRPSRLLVRVEADAGRAHRVFVAGQVFRVARGVLEVPKG